MKENCACIVSDCERNWALKFNLICDEFNEVAKEDTSFISRATSSVFVQQNVLVLPLGHPAIKTLDIEDAVN